MGVKIGYVMCEDCTKHMTFCTCEGGVKAPKNIIKALDKLARI